MQHVELPALDRKLEILHVAVVPLELSGDIHELTVHLGLRALEIGDLLGRTNPRHHVLALRVAQILAVQFVSSGIRIARERHARSRVVAQVSEHHRDHVDGRSPVVGNLIEAPVIRRALGMP